MALSNDLISQFVKITKDDNKIKNEVTRYATVKITDGRTYVQFDGADILTPIFTTTNVKDGDRVTVQIKNHSATITGNLSSPSANGDFVYGAIKESEQKISVALTEQKQELLAELAEGIETTVDGKLSLSVDQLKAELIEADKAIIETLQAEIVESDTAIIGDLQATNAEIYRLEGVYGEFRDMTVGRLDVVEGRFDDLDAKYASINHLEANYASIAQLEAVTGDIDILNSDLADINTLIFGSASGNVIHSNFANAVVAQLGNAQIKSAMIESIAADKITAGDIITNNVKVKSADGSLVISDETMQISDENRVRVQIGKDAAGDYSINIWDESGNLMFSEGGITDKAIKQAIIRNDMVANNANIAADKLDIDSLFKVINEDGSHTLKSSKIMMDGENQTLNVSFGQITTKVTETTSKADKALADASKAQKSIDNLEIGGRNLLLKTNQGKTNWNYIGNDGVRTITEYVGTDGVRGVKLTNTTASSNWSFAQYNKSGVSNFLAKIEPNTEYTLSFDMMTNVSSSVGVSIRKNDSTGSITNNKVITFTNDEKWHKYSVVLTTLSDVSDTTDRILYFGTLNTVGYYIIKNLKLEKGTKATDWTPAPEDVDSSIASVDTKADTASGKADNAQTVANNAQSAANKAQSDIDNLEIGGRNLIIYSDVVKGVYINNHGVEIQHATNISTGFIPVKPGDELILQYWQPVNSYVSPNNAWTSYIVCYDAEKAYLEGDSGGLYFSDEHFVTKKTVPDGCYYVRASYQLPRGAVSSSADWDNSSLFKWKLEKGNRATDWTPAPEDVEAEITTITETVTSQGTDISVLQGQINSKIWQQDITTAVESIEVGGRNLLYNSNFTKDFDGWVNGGISQSIVDDATYDKALCFYTTAPGDVTHRLYPDTTKFTHVANETYTLSFMAKASVATQLQSNVAGGFNIKNYDLTTSWQKFTHTYTTASTGSLTFLPIEANVSIYLTNIKLEKGTIATDWTPAPEDLEGEVQNLTTQYSELNQDLNEISATVGKHETDISGTKSQLSDLTVDLSGFKTTVSETYTTKSAFDALDVGTRNLIKGTNQGTTNWGIVAYNGTTTLSPVEALGVNALKIAVSAASTSYHVIINKGDLMALIKKGGIYTIAFDVYPSSDLTVWASYRCHDATNNCGYWSNKTCPANTWTHYESTITFNPNVDITNSQVIYLTGFNVVGEHIIANLMLVEGNKVGSWQPAPEDVEASITSAKETVIQQTNEAIALKASKTEVTTAITDAVNGIEIGGRNLLVRSTLVDGYLLTDGSGDITKISGAYNKTSDWIDVSDCDSVVISLYDSFTTDSYYIGRYCLYDANKTCLTTVTFNPRTPKSVIAHTTNSSYLRITAIACQTYRYKIEKGNRATDWTPAPEDVDANISALGTRVTSTEAALNVNSESITSVVKRTESLEKWSNDLEIGGRNLWLKTKEYDAKSYTGWVDNNDGRRTFTTVPHTTVNGFGVQRIASMWSDISQRVPIEPYTDYTLSAWIKWESEAGTLMFYDNVSPNSGKNVTTQVGTDTYKRVSVTFHSNNATVSTCRFECSTNIPYLIYGLKLEKGNKPTDWSPAPEDIVAEAEASFQVTADAIRGEVTAAEGRMSTLVEQTAEDFTVKIDGIEIGGRNLLYNSNFKSGFYRWVNSGMTVEPYTSDSTYKHAIRFYTPVPGNSTYRMYQDISLFTHVVGETYTLSFMAKADVNTQLQSNVAASHNVKNYDLTTSWQKFTHTYKATSSGSLTFWPNVANVWIYLTNIKLEKGNKPTDWTPAPEDVDSSISSVDTKATNAQNAANNAQSTADSSVNARNGYSIKWNCSAFSSKNDGEAYICAKDKTTNVLSDANGTVMFNGITRTVTKGMINPNANLPYNRTIYIVMRLSSASATTGTNYLVWYNSGWKYSGIDLATSSTISDWTWNASTDIVLGSFVEPNSEAALVDCCIYEPPLTADQVTNGASAHILANNAQSTANTASGKADAAQSTANTASSKADTAQSMATEAGKTAINYMRFSQNGLVIGDHTAGTLGKNVLINNDSVNIRNGDKVLASYGDNTIRLGVEDYDSTISLCKDVGVISAAQDEVTGYYDILKISSKEGSIDINSKQGSTLTVHNSANGSTWGSYIGSFENNVHAMVHDFRDGEPLQGLTRFYLHPNVIEMDTQSSITGKYVHLNLDGYNGYIQASSEIISTNPNGFRIVYGNYGSFIRNDGNATYFMLTNSGDQYGNWNGLRPLIINNSTGNVTINNSALEATGDITPGRDLLVKNGYSIFCKNASGSQVNALHMNSSNVMIFGYGAYTMGYVARYAGAAVEIGTPQGNFRPYFRPGDSVRLLWYGGGYITGSGKNLRYTIPLSKPAVGCSGVTVATANGYVIRQNGNYCYGSSASTTTKAVASSNGSIENNNHVRVQVEFDNNTNTTNNDGAGIEASITLTFV